MPLQNLQNFGRFVAQNGLPDTPNSYITSSTTLTLTRSWRLFFFIVFVHYVLTIFLIRLIFLGTYCTFEGHRSCRRERQYNLGSHGSQGQVCIYFRFLDKRPLPLLLKLINIPILKRPHKFDEISQLIYIFWLKNSCQLGDIDKFLWPSLKLWNHI